MLIINEKQREYLALKAVENFESRMVEHIHRYFPGHAALLGEADLRATTQAAMQRAARHELISQRDVCFYLNLALMFGVGFADDPQLPWISQYLAIDAHKGNPERMSRLYGKCVEYLEHIAGPGNIHVLEGLKRVSQIPFKALDPAAEPPAEFALRLFQYFHPQKARLVGDAALRRLLDEARRTAPRLGLGSPPGHVLTALLMFFLGHDFHGDPQLPWVRKVLGDAAAAGAPDAAERLFMAAQTEIPRWLKALEG